MATVIEPGVVNQVKGGSERVGGSGRRSGKDGARLRHARPGGRASSQNYSDLLVYANQ